MGSPHPRYKLLETEPRAPGFAQLQPQGRDLPVLVRLVKPTPHDFLNGGRRKFLKVREKAIIVGLSATRKGIYLWQGKFKRNYHKKHKGISELKWNRSVGVHFSSLCLLVEVICKKETLQIYHSFPLKVFKDWLKDKFEIRIRTRQLKVKKTHWQTQLLCFCFILF